MKIRTPKFLKVANQCWKEVSFKDKGLILIMLVLLLQCIHNLYNGDPSSTNYLGINIIIRTSVSGIFGYFLSSNFLIKADDKKFDNTMDFKLEILEEILENNPGKACIEEQNKLIKTIDQEEKKSEKRHVCNNNLQNGIAVGICVIILSCLIIGINFELIEEGATVTIAQFRDLVSGSIGFLLGSDSKSK